MAVFLRWQLITSHSQHSYAAAQSGGALSAGLNGTYVRVEESRFESNHAKVRCNSSSVSFVRRSDHYRWQFLQAVGGAVLLYKEGMFDLLRSTTFQANFATNSTDGTGIVNLGGEVQCSPLGCLPVCTTCVSPPPTPQPTRSTAPTHPAQVMPHADGAADLSSEWVLVLVLAMSVAFVSISGCAMLHRRAALNEQAAAPTVESARILEMRLLVDDESSEERNTFRDSSDRKTEQTAASTAGPVGILEMRSRTPDTLSSSEAGDWKAVAQMSNVSLSINGWSAAASFASNPDDQSDAQSASNPGSRGDPAFVASSASLRENGKTLDAQILVAALSSSPAPIFVVDHTMRITSWSQGE